VYKIEEKSHWEVSDKNKNEFHGASECWLDGRKEVQGLQNTPVALRQGEAIEVPRYVRSRVAGGDAFERNRRSWLHRLVDKLVQKLRMGSCNATHTILKRNDS
jgi:hypothetical protein